MTQEQPKLSELILDDLKKLKKKKPEKKSEQLPIIDKFFSTYIIFYNLQVKFISGSKRL